MDFICPLRPRSQLLNYLFIFSVLILGRSWIVKQVCYNLVDSDVFFFFREAYEVARMGVTEADWSQLAHESLNALELEIANQAFQRIQDLKYLELMDLIANQKRMGVTDHSIFIGDILAWQGKFHDAARLYRKCGRSDKAVALFTDLRLFDQAQVSLCVGVYQSKIQMHLTPETVVGQMHFALLACFGCTSHIVIIDLARNLGTVFRVSHYQMIILSYILQCSDRRGKFVCRFKIRQSQ